MTYDLKKKEVVRDIEVEALRALLDVAGPQPITPGPVYWSPPGEGIGTVDSRLVVGGFLSVSDDLINYHLPPDMYTAFGCFRRWLCKTPEVKRDWVLW